MKRKNRPPQLSFEKIVYAVVLSAATYYSVSLIVQDF